MSDLFWMAAVIGASGVIVTLIFLSVALNEAKRDINYLRRELNDKVSDHMVLIDRNELYRLARKVEAIKLHLNITIEEEPAKLVVKEKT